LGEPREGAKKKSPLQLVGPKPKIQDWGGKRLRVKIPKKVARDKSKKKPKKKKTRSKGALELCRELKKNSRPYDKKKKLGKKSPFWT